MPLVQEIYDSSLSRAGAKSQQDEAKRRSKGRSTYVIEVNPYIKAQRSSFANVGKSGSGVSLKSIEADNAIEDPHKNLKLSANIPDFMQAASSTSTSATPGSTLSKVTSKKRKLQRSDLITRTANQVVELERRMYADEQLLYDLSQLPDDPEPPDPAVVRRCTVCGLCGNNYKCSVCEMRYCSVACGQKHKDTRCQKWVQ